MATPTWQDVIDIAPGDAVAFGAMPTNTQNAFMAIATAQMNVAAWGQLYNAGFVYLCAHLAKLGLLRGSGPITSETLDRMSRTYGTVQGIKGSLGLTSYGAEYLRLIRLLPSSIGACC